MKPLLDIVDLNVSFETPAGRATAVKELCLKVGYGEAMGIVGESGCGKSVTAHSVMRLLPPASQASGRILFEGRDVLQAPETVMQTIRGRDLSMIFQDPMTSLNPVLTVGAQIAEVIERHRATNRREAWRQAEDLLRLVSIADPQRRIGEYPHQFSGGMRQRVMIAMAIACQPKLLIADEPTTALDVTVQAQILDLLKGLQQQFHTAIMLISHDLGVIARLCSRVAVMYAGIIVETGSARDIFRQARHPYTWGLLKASPRLDTPGRQRLTVIEGQPPNPWERPQGCPFHPRCPYAMRICTMEEPEAMEAGIGHFVRCWLQHPGAPKVTPKEAG